MRPLGSGATLAVLGLCALGALGACSSSRQSGEAPPTANPQVVAGLQAFEANCQRCHTGEPGAVGPAIQREHILFDWQVRHQVRHGGGGMPAFAEDQVSDDELGAIIAYLKVVRRHGGRLPGS
jgi:mono/diheme cytochrome c family protein